MFGLLYKTRWVWINLYEKGSLMYIVINIKSTFIAMLILKLGFFANAVLPAHGPFARYVKFRVAHGPGMPGTFSPPPRISDPDMHHGTCVTDEPWCMSGSLTSGFLWSRWRGKCSRHSRCMRNPQFYVSGKRPMVSVVTLLPLGNLVICTVLQKQYLQCV